ncbi:cytosolic phospholipase A2 epsilon isoform X1 [Zootoca vivipara]|uniref:cytosolic phospholipase A2 epsilon isoform X1 n=1 Tax=Zootoca vivipara TaxID=8524 RepID=UPI00293BDDCD|nr:cytosolic phospholipase A2 epsilon isoform X1 [Zootoca vivipara]
MMLAPFCNAKEMEVSPCHLLCVKIIQIKNLRKADLFSQSDGYVSLYLPTASFERPRTKTIKDCKDPVWNETFYFRIQTQVKNVLEMVVHDEDHCLMDNNLCTVLFDVSKIQLGERVCLTFPLDPKIPETLEVEFSRESIPVPHEHIVTNGVLVSREISCLGVQVNGGTAMNKKPGEENFTFSAKGSYEESQDFTLGSELGPADPLVFHCIKYMDSALEIEPAKKPHSCIPGESNDANKRLCFTLPLDSLSMEKEVTIGKDKTVDLRVNVKEWLKNLDVRLGYELCIDEQTVIQKRKKLVAAALERALGLKKGLQDHEVPVVAVMTTGGGARAFTALHGNLYGLQKLNLLDCISYITGSSGSTWALSNLYEHADWSQQDLSGAISEARKNMTKCKLDLFSLQNLKEYSAALEHRQKQGYKTCITDLWGLFIDKALSNGRCSDTLSGQKRGLTHSQNPLPIYMVLNTKDHYSLAEFKEWMEFTPFEVGIIKYGAYVRAEDFGSKFFMGRLMRKLPESGICFMKGVWSNVFSYNLLDSWRALDSSEEGLWYKLTRDRVEDIEERPPQPPKADELNTHLVIPANKFMKILREVLTESITTSKFYNFIKEFQLNDGYLDNKNFAIWKDTALDTLPNQLTATSEYLSIVDTAAYIDISYPPLLRPERKVDVIIHLNYSSGSQTSPLHEASRYFAKQGIPFPKIDLSHIKDKDLKECYVFEDLENSKAPIVIFFPLINDTFRKYKAPGVERSPSELKQGDVNVTGPFSPYGLQSFTYTEEDFDKLVGLTSYNIQNNEDSILHALRRAVERKRHQTK